MDKNNTKKQYLFLLMLIFFLVLPNLILIFIGEDSAVGTLLKKCAFFLIAFSIVIFPLLFLKPKYFSFLVILLFPLIVFESYHIFLLKTPSSEEIIKATLFTNFYEAKEFLQSNTLFFGIFLLIFLLILFLSRKIKKSFFIPKKQKKVILFIFLFTFISLEIRNFKLAFQIGTTNTEILGGANYSLRVQMEKNFPIGMFLKINGVYEGIQKKNKYLAAIKKFKFNASKKENLKENEIYVLVIGETARIHNFHIYGYPKNTSPNLDTIKNLTVFKNVNSNANLTSLSIPFMVTRATPENIEVKFNEPPVLKAFKESGFYTYWISNQQISIGSVFGLYAGLADKYSNVSTSLDAAGYDENIFPVLDTILKDTIHKKKLIVVHTIGSHYRYNYRYPNRFHIFKPTLSRGLSIENSSSYSNKTEITNSYNNSIRYTD
ncbi:MAG: phosphoethanolamine transferase, partial [Polaribacter sp.]